MQTESADKNKSTLCAIYTRVSTDMQAEVEFNSCEAQEERIRSFIASQEGFKIFKVYTDAGFTGANTHRPAMQDMLRDISAGNIDMVLTYKIDRLTRSPRDFYQLIELFEKHGAGFISVTERFDTSTPAGRLLRNIMLTFAQFERELASERVKDKVIQRVRRGMYFGGTPPFGYKVEEGKLVLDAPRDEAVRMIYNTYAETRSIRRIHDRVKAQGLTTPKGNLPTEAMIWHVLQNQTYTGKVVHKNKAHPGLHPAIITDDIFSHVQTLMKETPRHRADHVPALPFTGFIRCQECGSVMTSTYTDKDNKSGHRRYHYYRCANLTHKGWDTCSTRQINAERFHDMLYKNLLRISMDEDYLKNLVFVHNSQTRTPQGPGLEPGLLEGGLTPEKAAETLKEFLNICARRTGMERILAIRQRLAGINYSKKTTSVEFFYGRPSDAAAPDFARPPDGKRLSNQRPTTAASHRNPRLRFARPQFRIESFPARPDSKEARPLFAAGPQWTVCINL
ncbi:MAG: recombinase family protein [Elusimicrobia bacterium]|nr:recombinase family protein [Elusimicrobiota bacterium]